VENQKHSAAINAGSVGGTIKKINLTGNHPIVLIAPAAVPSLVATTKT
jgi:hypothetical protein